MFDSGKLDSTGTSAICMIIQKVYFNFREISVNAKKLH